MKFTNTETQDILNISIIDPKTGVDMIADLLQLAYDQELTLGDDGYEGDADAIEYYQKTSAQYQEAYDLMHEINQYGTKAQGEVLESILEEAQGYEVNDWAGYIIKNINEKIKERISINLFNIYEAAFDSACHYAENTTDYIIDYADNVFDVEVNEEQAQMILDAVAKWQENPNTNTFYHFVKEPLSKIEA